MKAKVESVVPLNSRAQLQANLEQIDLLKRIADGKPAQEKTQFANIAGTGAAGGT